MKKTYLQPETLVCLLHTGNVILEASKPEAVIDTNETVDPTKIESRRNYNVWGDEEEEDFEEDF